MNKKIIWNQITKRLGASLSRSEINTWLSPTLLKELDKESALIEVPNKYIATWLRDNFLDQIKSSFYEQLHYLPEIRFIHKGPESIKGPTKYKTRKKSSNTFNNSLNQLLTFSNFVTYKNSRFAFSLASEMAKDTGDRYSLLYLFSKVSCGKTHLMNAIANQVYTINPSAKVIYTPLEKLSTEYSLSKKYKKINMFRQQFRNLDVLLIDDIHRITGREKLQREIVSVIDHYHESQKKIAFAGKLPPGQILNLLPELQSRLEWGFLSEIKAPDQKTRMKIVKKKATVENISVPDDVAFFLASSISDLASLINQLIRLGAYSSLNKKPINISTAQSFLKSRKHHKVDITEIQKLTTDYFNISMTDLLSNKKTHKYAYPRHIAMYMSRDLTGFSFKEIARVFGNKDHSTIIYAVKRINREMNTKKEIIEDLNNLHKLLFFDK